MRYYYCTDQQTVKGPIHYEILRQMVLIKVLPKSFAVCREGTEEWEEYDKCIFPTPQHPLTSLCGARVNWWQAIIISLFLLGLPTLLGLWSLKNNRANSSRESQEPAQQAEVVSQAKPPESTRASSAITNVAHPTSQNVKATPPANKQHVPRVTTTIMGASKEDVDSILKGWTSARSNRSTALLRIYRYTKDVEMIVSFKDNQAVAVTVIDRPGAGVVSISPSRFSELVELIGEKPRASNIGEDSAGIHEFSVGTD